MIFHGAVFDSAIICHQVFRLLYTQERQSPDWRPRNTIQQNGVPGTQLS